MTTDRRFFLPADRRERTRLQRLATEQQARVTARDTQAQRFGAQEQPQQSQSGFGSSVDILEGIGRAGLEFGRAAFRGTVGPLFGATPLQPRNPYDPEQRAAVQSEQARTEGLTGGARFGAQAGEAVFSPVSIGEAADPLVALGMAFPPASPLIGPVRPGLQVAASKAGNVTRPAIQAAGRGADSAFSATLRATERLSPAKPAQALALKPASESLREMDKQIASVQRAIKTAREVKADTGSLDDTLEAMTITRRNILENELGPERFARFQELEGELDEAVFMRDSIREGQGGKAPNFGTPERAEYDAARRGKPPSPRAENLRKADILVDRLQTEYDRLQAGLPDEVAREVPAAPRTRPPSGRTKTVADELERQGQLSYVRGDDTWGVNLPGIGIFTGKTREAAVRAAMTQADRAGKPIKTIAEQQATYDQGVASINRAAERAGLPAVQEIRGQPRPSLPPAPRPAPATGAVQTRMLGEGAGTGQAQMLPEFRGTGETPRQRVQADAAERAAREAEAARTAPLEGQAPLSDVRPAATSRHGGPSAAEGVPASTPPLTEAAEAAPATPPVQAAPPPPGGRPPAPPTGGGSTPPQPPGEPPDPQSLVSRLAQIIREAKPAREMTEQAVSKELGVRAARSRSALARGDVRGARGAFAGELPKAGDLTPLEQSFTPQDGQVLRGMIVSRFQEQPFKWIQADTAFTELFGIGRLPTRSQLAVLEEVFGSEFVEAVLSKRGMGERAWEKFLEAWNAPRAFVASGDLSATLNQAAIFAFEGKGEPWRNAFKAQLKAFAKESNAKAVSEAIASHPLYESSQRAGLDLTLPSSVRSGTIASREEPYIGARVAKKVPLFGKLVEASERAYVTMLNKTRFDVFANEAAKLGNAATPSQLREIATTINIATGRGDLGKANQVSALLNGVFFAPRYAVSRFQLPARVLMGNAPARKLAARSLVGYTTRIATLLALADISGVGEVTWDPRSSDFGKLRIGNTRIDPWMGLQQPVVLVARLLTGQTKDLETGEVREFDPGLALQRFFESKLHPSARSLLSTRRGEVFGGEGILDPSPLGVPNIIFDAMVPLFLQDIFEAIEEYGPVGASLGPYTFLGGRVSTFDTSGEESTGRVILPPSRSTVRPRSQQRTRQRLHPVGAQ